MDSDHLQRWQVEKIRDIVRERLTYLTRFKSRIEKAGFSQGDPLFQCVAAAQAAAQALFMECHYLSCESGVGRPKKRESTGSD